MCGAFPMYTSHVGWMDPCWHFYDIAQCLCGAESSYTGDKATLHLWFCIGFCWVLCSEYQGGPCDMHGLPSGKLSLTCIEHSSIATGFMPSPNSDSMPPHQKALSDYTTPHTITLPLHPASFSLFFFLLTFITTTHIFITCSSFLESKIPLQKSQFFVYRCIPSNSMVLGTQ